MKIDLDLVDLNLRNGNYLLHQVPPYAIAFIARIRELEAFIVDIRGVAPAGRLPHFIREDADALLEKGAVIDDAR